MDQGKQNYSEEREKELDCLMIDDSSLSPPFRTGTLNHSEQAVGNSVVIRKA